MEPEYNNSNLQNIFPIQINTEEMEVEENNPQITQISNEVLMKRKPESELLPSSNKNRRITIESKKRKPASLGTSLDRSHDKRNDKKIKTMETMGVGLDFFSMIERWKTPELEKEILAHIDYAKQQNTVKELTQKTFEYQANEKPLYFQISYAGDIENPDKLILQKVDFPQDPQQVILIETIGEVENSENASKRIEKLFFENFEAIVNEVRIQGYWKLPSHLQQQISSFQKVCGFTQFAAEKEKAVEQNKKLFSDDRDLLERFCTLKIKEICSCIKKGGKPPRSPVWLSILREEDKEIDVTEVEIFFEDGLAVMPLALSKKKYPSLIEALFSSSWMDEESDRTIIRFSDHHLEDNLAIKKYCKEIEYGLLSSQIRPKETGELNFWEDLAFNWKKRAKSDFSQIETVKRILEKNLSSELVDVAPEIQKLADREGINQADYVHFILRNQRSGRGTLLNLPTGFGKTFIIFYAAVQHIKSIGKENKKPYLVIVPASNVMRSWIDNHQLLTQDLGSKGDLTFSNKNSLVPFDSSEKFLAAYEKPEFRNIDFIVMTKLLLSNIVNDLLSLKASELSATHASFLRSIGILSQDNFILGDQSFWEKRIGTLNSWNYQTEMLEVLQEVLKNNNLRDIFYPTDQKNELDKNELDKKRKIFISGFEAICKQRIDVADRFSEDFFPKISSLNGEGERCINSEKLFDYCHFLFFFKQSRKKEEVFFQDLWNELSPILASMSEEQKKLLEKYDAFKSSFNGLILDESDQILVAKGGGASEQTDILLDIAKTFQTHSKKNNPQNPLLIASSATPWPNAMNELKLHLKFLLPKVLGQFRDLHDDLFGKWNSFEASLDRMYAFKSPKANADQTDEKNPSPKKSQEGSLSTLSDNLNTVQTHFYQWVRLLFDATVSYQKPVAGETNNSTEEVLYVSSEGSSHMPAGKETFSLIKNFYSGLLQPNSSVKQRNLLIQIFEHLNEKEHFAYFVELQKDAAYLGMQISDYYQKQFGEEVQIGLFYNETFVEKQKLVKTTYKNITFNTDRMVNINTFNNIFCFDDLYKYIDQYFGKLSISKTKSVKDAIPPLVDMIRCIQEKENPREEAPNGKNSLVNMGKIIAKNRKNEKPAASLSKHEQELYKIFKRLIRLEKKSKAQIIKDFSQELEVFKPFIGKKLQKKSTVEAFRKYSADAMKKIKQRDKKKEHDPIEDLKMAIFHYLNKIHQSKILIYGNAGTSGMRIDADCLTVLSGAWTEGKLSQIKGRVGRLKGAGDSRPCKIYLPITSTRFEFFILRYYIKKALYNLFITSKEYIGSKALCQHLFLSGSLFAYYNRCNSKDGKEAFYDPSIHQIIKERIGQSQEYLTLGAYEKALTIIPQEIRNELQQFEQEILENHKLQLIRPMQGSLSMEELMPDASEFEVKSSEEDSAGKPDTLIGNRAVNTSNSPNKPEHPPRIQPADNAAWSNEELEKVKKQVLQSNKEKVVIFLVPTRGEKPDIPLQEFSGYIRDSMETDCYPIVIYGVNHSDAVERKIESSHPESSDFFAKITPFTWFEEDRYNQVLPFGQMRNFCLEQAMRVWEALTAGDHPVKDKKAIYLVSMDGDTQLTSESFQQMMKKVRHADSQPYVVATGGYDFAAEASDWSKQSNRIGMQINHGCQTEVKPLHAYYGYLAEPSIAISPSLLQRLFEQKRKNSFFQMENQKMAPFGFWNFEGRRLQRYLNQLVGRKLNSFGPPPVSQERPILKNYARFTVEAPQFSLKQHLSKENLVAVISRLSRQPQHSIRPFFMASNIAYHHQQKSSPVKRFASFFYAKNILNLLQSFSSGKR